MLTIGDYSVIVDRYLCQPEFVRWRKNHKRPRINKKWHKRYGAVVECKGHSYIMRADLFAGAVFRPDPPPRTKTKLICCPCVYEALKRAIDAHERMITVLPPRLIVNSTVF